LFPNLKNYVVILEIDTLIKDCQIGIKLEEFKKTFSLSFIYITASTFQETLQHVRKYKLPLPTVFICENGAAIHFAPRFIRHARWGYSLRTISPSVMQYIIQTSGLTLKHKPSQSCYIYSGTKQQCTQFNHCAKAKNIPLLAKYVQGDVIVCHESITIFSALTYIFHRCGSATNAVIATQCVTEEMYEIQHYRFIVLQSAPPRQYLKKAPHVYVSSQPGMEGIIEGWHHYLHQQI